VTDGREVVVPALALRTPGGTTLNAETTARYAQRAARTWIDAFILSGSTTRGDLLTHDERTELLDLWLRVAAPTRLVACCWCDDDVHEATRRAITPMIVMRSLRDNEQALSLLAALPRGAYVYSHPKYDSRVLDVGLTVVARRRGVLPAGAKLSKVTTEDIAALRRAAGPRWTLWDASSRHIAASLAAGASGVVASPLSHFPRPFPDRTLPLLQPMIDAIQTRMDQLPTRDAVARCCMSSRYATPTLSHVARRRAREQVAVRERTSLGLEHDLGCGSIRHHSHTNSGSSSRRFGSSMQRSCMPMAGLVRECPQRGIEVPVAGARLGSIAISMPLLSARRFPVLRVAVHEHSGVEALDPHPPGPRAGRG
jgi:hypothetical protein